jgi:hypothetical protein
MAHNYLGGKIRFRLSSSPAAPTVGEEFIELRFQYYTTLSDGSIELLLMHLGRLNMSTALSWERPKYTSISIDTEVRTDHLFQMACRRLRSVWLREAVA